jgi:hypothetical protein
MVKSSPSVSDDASFLPRFGKPAPISRPVWALGDAALAHPASAVFRLDSPLDVSN